MELWTTAFLSTLRFQWHMRLFRDLKQSRSSFCVLRLFHYLQVSSCFESGRTFALELSAGSKMTYTSNATWVHEAAVLPTSANNIYKNTRRTSRSGFEVITVTSVRGSPSGPTADTPISGTQDYVPMSTSWIWNAFTTIVTVEANLMVASKTTSLAQETEPAVPNMPRLMAHIDKITFNNVNFPCTKAKSSSETLQSSQFGAYMSKFKSEPHSAHLA